MTCKVCGVTLQSGFVNADHPTSDPGLPGVKGSKLYTYRDIKGNVFTSTKPLGCPAFMFDAGSAAMENRGYIREINENVEVVEGRVGQVETTVGSVKGRLTALEEENGDRLDALEQENIELRAMLQETHEIATVASHRVAILMKSRVKVDDDLADLPPLLASILRDENTEQPEEKVEVVEGQADVIPIRRTG